MSSPTSGVIGGLPHSALGAWRCLGLSIGLATCVALVVAGCGSSAATAGTSPTVTVAAATPTGAATATATPTPTPTPMPTAAPTATPTPTSNPTVAPVPTKPPAPVVTPAPTPAPLPALAIGLCTGAQLSLSITAWVGDPGAGTVYAHVTATNVSSASCNMRGTSRAQILDGGGSVIADAGSGAAAVSSSDPVYTLAPNGTINTIVQWGNWCGSAPAQNVKVGMVEPFGLGRIVAPALGAGSVPTCYASGSPTMVSSEAWLP